MTLRRTVFTATLLLLTPTAFAQKAVPTTYELNAVGDVDIGPDGTVRDFRVQNKLAPDVAALVDRNVRSWHFEPILVDGTAVTAKTSVHILLTAVEATGVEEKSYTVRVAGVRFGEPKSIAGKAPRYPQDAVHMRLQAKVVLSVRLDDAGHVVDAQPYQTSLDKRANSEFEAERWRKVFENVCVAAAKSWQYDLTQTINGKRIETFALVPFVFSLRESGHAAPSADSWKAYVPGPVHPPTWAPVSQLVDNRDLSLLQQGEALPLASRFHLKDDVIGKAL